MHCISRREYHRLFYSIGKSLTNTLKFLIIFMKLYSNLLLGKVEVIQHAEYFHFKSIIIRRDENFTENFNSSEMLSKILLKYSNFPY